MELPGERSVKAKQRERIGVYRTTRTNTHSGWAGQMTSWIGVCLFCAVGFCCPSVRPSGGGGGGRGGGRFLFLCLYFRASGGSSHGRTGSGFVSGGRATSTYDRVLSLPPLTRARSLPQLERTRAVHVTSRLSRREPAERGGGRGRGSRGSGAHYLWDTPPPPPPPRATCRGAAAVCFVWQVQTVPAPGQFTAAADKHVTGALRGGPRAASPHYSALSSPWLTCLRWGLLPQRAGPRYQSVVLASCDNRGVLHGFSSFLVIHRKRERAVFSGLCTLPPGAQ